MKTQQATHTPTPWKVEPLNPYILGGPEECGIFQMNDTTQGKADAAFIVRAVNNYEQMLLALKNIALLNEAWETTLYHPIKKMAMAAIAKAEEI